MDAKSRTRDMWKAIPWKRRAEIADQISSMPDGMRKQVLTMAFVENMSTADIARYAEENDTLYSRNHKPISKRRVLQIIAEEVPDYNAYQDHSQKDDKRKDHRAWIWRNKKTNCAICGSAERLEWHHMLPAAIGCTAEPENMICLCRKCHRSVTEYHKRIMPDVFCKRRKQQKEN